MTMHPQTKAYLQYVAANNPMPADATLEERRADTADYIRYAGPVSNDVDTEHTYFTSPTADLHAVIFRPKNVKPNAPALVYFHGGGWVFSWTLRYAPQMSNIAAETGFVVIGINYQKAPEHPFPTPFDDCYAGLLWVAKNAARFGIDPAKIGVGGDSAGGNLAAAVALKAADTGDVKLAYQMLIYPCLDTNFQAKSYLEHETGFGLESVGMQWCWSAYVPEAHLNNKYAVPARATSFKDVAPAIIGLAEHDVLRDDGANYAAALEKAGVPVTLKEYPGMIHGFFTLIGVTQQANNAIDYCSAKIVELTL